MSAPCPICAKPSVQQFRPFCSKRCSDVDLSRWLKGGYAIPGEPAEDAGDAEQPPKSRKNEGFDDPDDA